MILHAKDPQGTIHVLLEKRDDDYTLVIPDGAPDVLEVCKKAAIREGFEETGISIDSVWCVTRYQLPYFSYWVYASRFEKQQAPIKNWESDAIEWFAADSIPEGMNRMTRIKSRTSSERRKSMWSEELRRMTIEHFGDFGAAILKTVVNGKYSFSVGFDRNIYITDSAESLIPESEKDKRYFIFTMDDCSRPAAFLKAYDFIENLVDDGWAID